jgi:hypothetical protein
MEMLFLIYYNSFWDHSKGMVEFLIFLFFNSSISPPYCVNILWKCLGKTFPDSQSFVKTVGTTSPDLMPVGFFFFVGLCQIIG